MTTDEAKAQNPTTDTSADAGDASSVARPAASDAERLVPVTEAIRYRKRAQAAEQQAAAMEMEMGRLREQLSKTQQTIAQLERRQKIDALLSDAEAVDFEVARLLTEAAVELMEEPDVSTAIQELRRSKPYLFRQRSRSSAQAMSARGRDGHAHAADEAAHAAVQSGDRRDLLHYLRLRRSGAHALRA